MFFGIALLQHEEDRVSFVIDDFEEVRSANVQGIVRVVFVTPTILVELNDCQVVQIYLVGAHLIRNEDQEEQAFSVRKVQCYQGYVFAVVTVI